MFSFVFLCFICTCFAVGRLLCVCVSICEGHANGSMVAREQFYQMGPAKRNEKPPQLPPRDNGIYAHSLPTVSVCIDYYYYFYCNCHAGMIIGRIRVITS